MSSGSLYLDSNLGLVPLQLPGKVGLNIFIDNQTCDKIQVDINNMMKMEDYFW